MSEHSSTSAESAISRSRLEVLFDGIFAIAMTLLVLELKVPELADGHSRSELSRALAHDGPTFLSYLLSFWLLGVLWYRHNQLYRHIERVSRRMLALQLLQLATAAFIPFCAALVGRYPGNPLSLVVYSGCIMVCQWASAAYWLVATRTGAVKAHLDPSEYRAQGRRNLRSSLAVTAIFIYGLVVMLVH
jgi:uncharacterized membrane protein